MKLSDLEGVETLATKEDLRHLATKADIQEMRGDLLELILTSERGQRSWIWGLYGLVIVIAGAQWAGITFILHQIRP